MLDPNMFLIKHSSKKSNKVSPKSDTKTKNKETIVQTKIIEEKTFYWRVVYRCLLKFK